MRDNTQHLYNNFELRKLLIPIIVEQLLSSLIGTADTMMVSNVGSAAISAVSLVDSINILVIQALSALSAGGAILCSQYLGSQNKKRCQPLCKAGFICHGHPVRGSFCVLSDLP